MYMYIILEHGCIQLALLFTPQVLIVHSEYRTPHLGNEEILHVAKYACNAKLTITAEKEI